MSVLTARLIPLALLVQALLALTLVGAPAQADEPRIRYEILHSAALGKDMPLIVYLPPGYDDTQRYPVLYLFHGMLENEQQWERIGVFEEADALIEEGGITPLIIVLPRLENSFGLNGQPESASHIAGRMVPLQGGAYEDYLAEELPAFVEQRFSAAKDRDSRYVGGLSMGGFAALHLALRHPRRYARVGGHSPALVENWGWLYPDAATRATRDPQALAATADLDGLSVYLDCGEQDEFQFQFPTRRLGETLGERGVATQTVLRGGHHSFGYWSEHVGEYLRFYSPPGVRSAATN
ncbi:alpha/beta hydrolase-fold protein [Niveibacterium sp. SC-1]|uniref:alpha/beta hydrolase n=1 Tax=Niveibacterium sp. SC-1 TaxID=3135646 RepID=UPI00311E5979